MTLWDKALAVASAFSSQRMDDLISALGLVLVFEGALYALFPHGVKRMMMMAQELPPPLLRGSGLAVALAGGSVVWLVRG